ncbi:MAG TPA: hypothetical protein GXX53_04540 [Tissierellia bacterium]|nr:hypothetical protein [Tissierellia bacterium]
MRIRFITKEQVRKAYGKRKKGSTLDVREGLGIEDMDNVPQEVFSIIGETLSFIKYINTREDESDENK